MKWHFGHIAEMTVRQPRPARHAPKKPILAMRPAFQVLQSWRAYAPKITWAQSNFPQPPWNEGLPHELCSREKILLQILLHCHKARESVMNNLIWLVGAVVIIIAILGFFGLRV